VRVLTIVSLLIGGGCFAHAGTRQVEGWKPSPDAELRAEAERDHEGRLRIIICYGQILSNHSTLRITCPQKPVLFWDPGGEYLEGDPAKAGRRADLVLGAPPTLQVFWETRQRRYQEPFMEVYEYDLENRRALELHEAMMAGIDPDNDFQADRLPMFCCIGVCDFLQRYMKDRLEVSTQYVMPHRLGWDLWEQKPDRVLVFRAGKAVDIYLPGLTPNEAEVPREHAVPPSAKRRVDRGHSLSR